MTDLYCGDCLEIMVDMAENSVDTIITDPPYGLSFMGKDWDYGVPGVHFWQAALRVAKPGALLLAFGGTRTFHRLAVAIEDAGWEIRDTIMWVYGSGFPKSLDISKAIDNAAGAEREVIGINEDYLRRKPNGMLTQGATTYGYSRVQQETDARITAPATPAAARWQGWGTALKPAWEPIIVAMKPLDGTFANNALTHGVAGLWVDGGRVEYTSDNDKDKALAGDAFKRKDTSDKGWSRPWMEDQERIDRMNAEAKQRAQSGRWPANVIHDGSDEVVGLFPYTKSGAREGGGDFKKGRYEGQRGAWGLKVSGSCESSEGSAARFFYCAKASRGERNAGLEGMEEKWIDETRKEDAPGGNNPRNRGARATTNHHPTVKPLALMQYLCRLTKTPTGGVVLDPFMGSGTTGVACVNEGREFIGIEIDPNYLEIAMRRIEHAQETSRQLALVEL